MSDLLDKISQPVRQTIFECISQALCEDLQEANAYLDLKTRISKPFLRWDFINRNLITEFGKDNVKVKYATAVRGMWTVLLLYDVESGLLISFMSNTRLEAIKHLKDDERPKYIRSLIALNRELHALNEQVTFFEETKCSYVQNEADWIGIFDSLCAGFDCQINHSELNHIIVSFSSNFESLSSLKASVLDGNFKTVEQQNWFDMAKPVMSNEVETVECEHDKPTITLKSKAKDRLKEKGLVEIREKENKKQA